MSATDRLVYWKRRCLIAEQNADFERRNRDHMYQWVAENLNRERHLSDRCTYLYGLAAKHGATPAELRGEP